jgi:hypothetical protein
MRKSNSGSGHKGNRQAAPKPGKKTKAKTQLREGFPSDLDEGEAELLEGWGVYLKNRFPNPDRICCPGSDILQQMANEPKGFRDRRVIDHVARCSPCSDELRKLLHAARSAGKA